jgi:hypothetical protein
MKKINPTFTNTILQSLLKFVLAFSAKIQQSASNAINVITLNVLNAQNQLIKECVKRFNFIMSNVAKIN